MLFSNLAQNRFIRIHQSSNDRSILTTQISSWFILSVSIYFTKYLCRFSHNSSRRHLIQICFCINNACSLVWPLFSVCFSVGCVCFSSSERIWPLLFDSRIITDASSWKVFLHQQTNSHTSLSLSLSHSLSPISFHHHTCPSKILCFCGFGLYGVLCLKKK